MPKRTYALTPATRSILGHTSHVECLPHLSPRSRWREPELGNPISAQNSFTSLMFIFFRLRTSTISSNLYGDMQRDSTWCSHKLSPVCAMSTNAHKSLFVLGSGKVAYLHACIIDNMVHWSSEAMHGVLPFRHKATTLHVEILLNGCLCLK
jgi:hypothetical protein